MDKTSMTLGWLVGQRIAGMRNVKREQKYHLGSLKATTLPIQGNFPHTSTWAVKEWNTPDSAVGDAWYLEKSDGFWSDGEHIYYSSNHGYGHNYVLKDGIWETKNWNVSGSFVYDTWTDGINIYYSNYETHYVLDNGIWRAKTWNIGQFYGRNTWTDGKNVYLSSGESQYVLKDGVWEIKVWDGFATPSYPWSDGINIYCISNYGTEHYVLNGNKWVQKEWYGLKSFYGGGIWSDGTHIYLSKTILSGDSEHYVLNGDTWETKVWNGIVPRSISVWTDGMNIYSSNANGQYVLV